MVLLLSKYFKQLSILFCALMFNVLPSSSYKRDYILVKATLPHDDSDALCSFLYGTSLASIHNDDENEAAIAQCALHNVSCWIGAHLGADGTLLWTDDTVFDYGYNASGGVVPWLENEPNELDGIGRCVLLHSFDSKGWNDTQCTQEHSILCNYPLSTTIINETINNIRVPIYDHSIGIMDVLDEVYVEFDFIIHKAYTYSNLLHIGNFKDLPIIAFHKNINVTELHLHFTRINEATHFNDLNTLGGIIALDTWYHFDFVATQTSVIALLNDSTIYNESEVPSHGIYMNQNIYISNRWNSPPDGSLRNLKITTNNAHLNPFNYLCDYYNRFTTISGYWSMVPSTCWLTQSKLDGGTVWLGDKDEASIEWTDYKIEFVVRLIPSKDCGNKTTNVDCPISTLTQAGLLFRTQSVHESMNNGAQYYVNIHQDSNQIGLNEINNSLRSLHYEVVTIYFNRDYTVRVEAISDEFRVYLDNRYQFTYYDSAYAFGSIGLRTEGTMALFKKLQIMFPDNNKWISMNPSKYPTKQPSNQPTNSPTDSTKDPTESPTNPIKSVNLTTSSVNTPQIIIISLSIICLSLCILVVFMYRRSRVKDDTDVKKLRNDEDMVNMIVLDDEVKEWLTTIVKLPQYFESFVDNGYDNIDSIKTISTKSQLEIIGIKASLHKTRIIAKIKELRQENVSKTRNVYIIRRRDIVAEIRKTPDGALNGDIDIDLMVVKFWLKSDVELPQYYDNFIQNEYNTLELIADINNVLQLNEIGIVEENDCIQILKAIELLCIHNEEAEDESEGDIENEPLTNEVTVEGVSDEQRTTKKKPLTSGVKGEVYTETKDVILNKNDVYLHGAFDA